MLRFFLTSVERFTEECIEPVEPIELYLTNMERYADNMEYKSHQERCTNHDVAYNTEYDSHKEMCTNDVEYKSKQKADQEGRVKLSYLEALAHLSTIGKKKSVDVTNIYIGVDELIADLHLGKIQELSVQELGDQESTIGSVHTTEPV